MNKVSRRRYLRSLLAEAIGMVDELRGEPHFFLDDIASLPDAVLRGMAPVVRQGMTLGIADGWLLLRKSPDAPFERLMPLSTQQIHIINCFDGQHSIADICGVMESMFDLSPDVAASLAGSLFVTLAEKGICHPKDRPE